MALSSGLSSITSPLCRHPLKGIDPMTAINRAEQLAVSKPHDHDAENCNSSGNPSLNDIIEARMSRRGVFRAAVGTAGTAVLGSLALSA